MDAMNGDSALSILRSIERNIGALQQGQDIILVDQRYGFDVIHRKVDAVSDRVSRLESRARHSTRYRDQQLITSRELALLILLASAGMAGLISPSEVKQIATTLLVGK